MPTKKTSKSTKVKSSAPVNKKVEEQAKPRIVMMLIIFILFISVLLLSVVLYRVSNEQDRLLALVDNLSDQVSKQQIVATDEANEEPRIHYSESAVSGLRLAYNPCKAKFTGPCDDLTIYRLNEDGSKEVIVPGVRNLSGAPLTNELLQPIAINTDLSRMAFGAWAYGGSRNSNDSRVWVVNTRTGKVIYQSDLVVQNAVFSPKMNYAVYYNKDEDGDGRLNLVDLEENEVSLLARASGGIYYEDQAGDVTLTWLDEDTVAVMQYEINESNGELELSGEREISIN